MIRATATGMIVVEGRLTPIQEQRLKDALTITNPDRERARREQVRGWEDIPKTIDLWGQDGDAFLVPRGMGDQLETILRAEIEWRDERVDVPIDTSLWLNPILRYYQEPACEAMCYYDQGVYEAPPAAGKTVTLLEAIRRIAQRSIVIVNSTHIAEQWRKRAREHLGITEVGLIGDGTWEEWDLTIALQQTLWMRRDSLDGWWATWGLVGMDECHHVPADTYYDIIQRFPARHRKGVSATPGKQKGREKQVRAAIGPTIHKTDEDELVEAGVILRQRVGLLETGFEHVFWPTHRAQKDKETKEITCVYRDAGCDKRGITHRNNYSSLMKALVSDDARNDLISNVILAALAEGRAILVLSRWLNHLDFMASRVVAELGTNDDIFRLSSKEVTGERMDLYERAEQGRVVIFSTIGDEALDIPRLDTLVLSFPSRNEGLLEQQIGRIARAHPKKLEPLVIDCSDSVKVLQSQLGDRLGLYRKKKLEVTTIDLAAPGR